MDKYGVSPVVAEVILIVMVVVLSAAILFGAMNVIPKDQQTPVITFTAIERDGNSINLYLSDSTPDSKFIDFKMIVISPEGTEMEAVFNGSLEYNLNETLTLFIIDLGGEGFLSNGDYFTLVSDGNITAGEWNFYLIFIPTGDVTASGSKIVM